MRSIKFTMKDGTTKEFHEQGRAGGSYTITLRTEGEFVIVTDEWFHQTWVPSADIAEITTDPGRCW